MRTIKETLNKLYTKFPKIHAKIIDKIIGEYQKLLLETMIENGHVYVSPEVKLEIVPITPRRYVLREKEYKSRWLYKLKATVVDDKLYEDISSEYDSFREDLP